MGRHRCRRLSNSRDAEVRSPCGITLREGFEVGALAENCCKPRPTAENRAGRRRRREIANLHGTILWGRGQKGGQETGS